MSAARNAVHKHWQPLGPLLSSMYMDLYDIMKFIRYNNGFKSVFPNWTEPELADAILKGINDETFLYAVDSNTKEITGIVLLNNNNEFKIAHVIGILTSRKNVLPNLLVWFNENYPGWTITGNRDKFEGLVHYTDPVKLYKLCKANY